MTDKPSPGITRFSKPIEELSREELIERVQRLRDRNSFLRSQMNGMENSYVKRLADYRKAKALANKRADKAEAAMRAMLDKFGETK